jgi:uncharacterized membrane protein
LSILIAASALSFCARQVASRGGNAEIMYQRLCACTPCSVYGISIIMAMVVVVAVVVVVVMAMVHVDALQ